MTFVSRFSTQNSDAERFASDIQVPFAIGYDGLIAENEGKIGDDVWWFRDGQTLVIYGTGESWMYHVPSDGTYEKELEAKKAFTSAPEFYLYKDEIRKVLVLDGVEKLNDYLLFNINIESIELGTVKYLGLTVLGNTLLKEVTIPETVELIRGFTFSECQQLSHVTILGDCNMELSIFHNTPNLKEVRFASGVRIQDGEFGDLFNQNDVEEYHEPNEELVFYVTQGSDAQRYAEQHDIDYQYYEE